MATLPRTHKKDKKEGNLLSSPFTTSPRKLQEMTLPVTEGHDLTNASGVSMKQYEEQLNGLRKENFHLKLRIYFLEEKLGSGSPPAVQGLLEHNVRLQVEVEELRRQLSDKQELLAAAAEAIDVLEQQGSVSTDSVEASVDGTSVPKDINDRDHDEDARVTIDPESETATGDFMAITVNNEDLDELTKLRRENHKALQMIKVCVKKIQQQNKKIKKMEMDKELVFAESNDSQLDNYEEILKFKEQHIRDLEIKVKDLQRNAHGVQSGQSSGNLKELLVYAHDRDLQLEKYEEVLKRKEEYIRDLEIKLKDLQKNVDSIQNDQSSGNLQELLTRRLQGLAFFLDKLLSHKCVLGEEKKKMAKSILEQSLALPVGLKLDESIAPEEFTMDESNFDISQSIRLEDLTLMFGHHVNCSDDDRHKRMSNMLVDVNSESECWSEPDRKVSLARIGLCPAEKDLHETTSDNARQRARRSRVSYGSRSEDNKGNAEVAFYEQINHLSSRVQQLTDEKNDVIEKYEKVREHNTELLKDKEALHATLAGERLTIIESTKSIDVLKTTIVTLESKIRDMEQELSNALKVAEILRSDRRELEASYAENERSLKRAADEATVQASQAALERARAQHDKLKIERELEETRDKLASVLEIKTKLEIEASRKTALAASQEVAVVRHIAHSDDERPTSPDQGIDSDRLSSLEHNDGVVLSPRSLYEENITLKQKLARTKSTLADTLAQLNAANMTKRSVQRAICREIHKTQGVLRKARDQFESHD